MSQCSHALAAATNRRKNSAAVIEPPKLPDETLLTSATLDSSSASYGRHSGMRHSGSVSLANCATSENDPLWRMPLWRPYEALLESKVADVNNVSSGNFGGSITAALFLHRFVAAAKAWLHCDIYAWNQTSKPGRPEGAECQAARALYALLVSRYG